MSHDLYDPIAEKPWSVRTMTLGSLLEHVRRDLGSGAVIDFDRDIATVAHCSCGKQTDLYTPVHKLKGDSLVCPGCGAMMQFDTVHSIHGDEDFLDKTLFEIGIPLFHIVCGRTGINNIYYEFTADMDEVLSF